LIQNSSQAEDKVRIDKINRLLPQVQEDYAANKAIVFPGLCLTQETIGKSDESLPWSEVEPISFSAEARLIVKLHRFLAQFSCKR
jgi:hypothetical protein